MEKLRVIDASIMPTMLSANLNAGVLMIAEKGLIWSLATRRWRLQVRV